VFNRNSNTLTLHENYELTEWKKPFVIHFITVLANPGIKAENLFFKKDNMEYDPKLFSVNVEKHVVEDKFLLNAWDHINKVNSVAKQISLHLSFSTILKIVKNN
jgi:hypothetical protein